jgi:hypothetical protein
MEGRYFHPEAGFSVKKKVTIKSRLQSLAYLFVEKAQQFYSPIGQKWYKISLGKETFLSETSASEITTGSTCQIIRNISHSSPVHLSNQS